MIELLHNPAFVFFASITLISLIYSVAHFWYHSKKASLDAGLKREMIQRGMSAEEIVQVLRAHSVDPEPAKK